ncbi:hypothetical protein GCM10010339_60280 [Streptomyces alanosinicus]|uniref:Uncharacterized protein n=1 Tax=Streptomyces alanosinicus TaxID=68171 RepID=A0A919D6L0_9ACTN|nr:hypothetical protein GCM10010339_60280 [Streptomyces alanosinicus]
MAGAHITDTKVFNPRSAGGKTRCGRNNVELLCIRAASGTIGGLVTNVTSGLNVRQIPSLARNSGPPPNTDTAALCQDLLAHDHATLCLTRGAGPTTSSCHRSLNTVVAGPPAEACHQAAA